MQYKCYFLSCTRPQETWGSAVINIQGIEYSQCTYGEETTQNKQKNVQIYCLDALLQNKEDEANVKDV